MTLKKLAELANVSISTVSKAMSGSNEISTATKNNIIKYAKQTGCFEKYFKYKYDKHIIAVLCPEVKSAFYSSIITYLEEKITKNNSTMIISITNFDAKTESELISFYISSKRADAIIVIDAVSIIKNNEDIPIAVMNSLNDLRDIDCVNIDFASAVNDALFYFKQNGHKDIGFIGEQLTKDKLDYFTEAMKKNNLAIKNEFIIVSKKRFEEAGIDAMEQIFKLKNMPTAIFAAYDYIALGIIQYIRKHNKTVPDDFSLIGVDDISFSSHLNIKLTTIKVNTQEICDLILDLIYKKINNKFYKLRQNITVRSELIIRDSVKNINKS
jgi:LacI family transcriptional regulator